MKKLLTILIFASGMPALATLNLVPGQTIQFAGETITCNSSGNIAPSTRCVCMDRGCSTAFTSAGNVILNVITFNPATGRENTECVQHSSEASCLQAMMACN